MHPDVGTVGGGQSDRRAASEDPTERGQPSDEEDRPISRFALSSDIAALGIPSNTGLLLHLRMSEIGNISGAEETLLAALLDAIGPDVTLVVPTQTANNSLTSDTYRDATRGKSDKEICDHIEAIEGFDPKKTPSHGMGNFAEYIRTRPNSFRSEHPQTSFAGVGPRAKKWMARHKLKSHLGEGSPLAKLYSAGAYVLLVGVSYDKCTAFHLAEYRVCRRAPKRQYTCFVQRGGIRHTVVFQARDLYDGDFVALGAAMQDQSFVAMGNVGKALAIAFPIRDAVDFAVQWMNVHRPRVNARQPT